MSDTQTKPNTIVVGIDSDTKGSIAVLDWESGHLDVYKFPYERVLIGKSKRARILEEETASLIRAVLAHHKPALVVVEEQWAREGQGAASVFTFGTVYGFLKGVIRGYEPGLSPYLVTGSVWKAAFSLTRAGLGIEDKGDKGRKELKKAARAYATKLFPNHGAFWDSEEYTSAAEASLIALYGLLRVLNYKPDRKTITPTGQTMGTVGEITDGNGSKRRRRAAKKQT